jgi:hypothetical protein
MARWRDLVTATVGGDVPTAERLARQLVLETRDTAVKMLSAAAPAEGGH